MLSTLNAFVGEKVFRDGLKRYLKKFAYANATYLDFFEAMQDAANQNLTAFRDAWLLQKGYPVLSYQKNWDPKSLKLSLSLSQRANFQDKSGDARRLSLSAFGDGASPQHAVVRQIDVDNHESRRAKDRDDPPPRNPSG